MDKVKAIRLGSDLGRKFAFCQALSAADRMGIPVLLTGQDEGCIMVLPAFGMVRFDPPNKIPESQSDMGWVKDVETACKLVNKQGPARPTPGRVRRLLCLPPGDHGAASRGDHGLRKPLSDNTHGASV
ncbi:MAG: hypothetical protein SWK76_06755 [Actinomycetota bacterium]|nr:hypothetical protein [Actinomycetota bacterium]